MLWYGPCLILSQVNCQVWLERWAMINQLRLADVPRISVEEARDLMESGNALFVDVRKREHYDRLRIPGAISIPIKGPADRYWSLPRDKDIVVY